MVSQEGELKKMNVDDDDDNESMGESVKGAYSYTDDNGETFSVSYTADERGYRPVRNLIALLCVCKMMHNF